MVEPNTLRQAEGIHTSSAFAGGDESRLFLIDHESLRRMVREEVARGVGVPRVELTYPDAAKAVGYSAFAL